MASAVAWRVYMANIRRIFMLELDNPLAVRRGVSFCEAVHDSRKTIEGVEAVLTGDIGNMERAWTRGEIAVLIDPQWRTLKKIQPDVLVDATLAKENLGTHLKEAQLVIGLGPGFCAGNDVHLVIETNRGHDLGRVITSGAAQPNTGIPGPIGGYAEERVLRASIGGVFHSRLNIGDPVKKDEVVGNVDGVVIRSQIGGVIRGLIRSNRRVSQGWKIGDIDPRGDPNYCHTISDKARAIAGSVLEAILRVFNRRNSES